MNILMMTNTYKPIVGGLERSIESFAEAYRRRGHGVLIVAPRQRGAPRAERGVFRVPAIPRFIGTDFAVTLPVPGPLRKALRAFRPDIVHAHHPFFIGDTALRAAYIWDAPLVFTHHTLYEFGTQYVPGDSRLLKRFVIELSTGFANLADRVFAPSPSMEGLLKARGVRSPIDVVPTGVDLALFGSGDRARGRKALGLPSGAFVAGYAGRLGLEKNLPFLCRAVARFLSARPEARFAVVGEGPLRREMSGVFSAQGMGKQVSFAGVLSGRNLADAYAAMDVFAFASKSETQCLSLIEAMAAGAPAVALDAFAVRDIVAGGRNGRLVKREDEEAFAQALKALAEPGTREKASLEARRTASAYSPDDCAERALAAYAEAAGAKRRSAAKRRSEPESVLGRMAAEMRADWKLVVNLTEAAEATMHKRNDDPLRAYSGQEAGEGRVP